jgi:flagellar basal body-associated protein FliL
MHSNNSFYKIIIVILIVVIAAIVVMLLLSPRPMNLPMSTAITTQQEQTSTSQQYQEGFVNQTDTNQEDVLPQAVTNSTLAQEMMTVRVPVDYDMVSQEVKFEKVRVSKSPGVLDAVLTTLFQQESQNGSYNGYNFESVSIQDGVAQVYLTGSHFPLGGLSMLYFRRFIEAAVFQYNTVDSLMVYVNSVIFDFCVDDQSGGEGGCPQTPQYWITPRN